MIKILLYPILGILSFKSISQCDKIKKDESIILEKCLEIDFFSNCQLFVLGETHFMKNNNFVWLKMIKSLNNEFGVTEVLIEDSPAKAYLLNEYLHFDDCKISEFIFLNKNEKKIYCDLKFELNKRNINEINIHGVDSEEDCDLLIYALSRILRKYDKQKIVDDELIQKLIEKDGYVFRSKEFSYELLDKFKSICENDKDFVSKITVKDFEIIKSLIASYDKMHSYLGVDFNNCSNLEKLNDREKYLADNVSRLMVNQPEKRFYGQFGSVHAPLTIKGSDYFRENCKIEWKSMVSMLNDMKIHSERIVSMQLIYNDKNYIIDYENLGLNEYFVKRNFDRLKKSELLILDNTKIDRLKNIEDNFDFHYFIFSK